MILERAKKLLLSPKEAWEEIAGESTGVKDLFLKYAVFLALIPAVSLLLGFGLVGLKIGPGYYRMPLSTAFFSAVLSYALNLAGVFAGGHIINFISQYFSIESNLNQAMKLSVYSSTAYWAAGIFGIIPILSFLSILGLYSVYILFLGIPILIKIPEDKVMPFTIVVVIALIVLGFMLNNIIGQFIYGPIYSDLLTY